MSKNPLSLILVEIQFLSLIFVFLTGPVIALGIPLMLEIIAIMLGSWSVFIMQKESKLSITPEVKHGSKLLKEGPYKYIRHPMYSTLLLLVFSLVLNFFTFQRLGLLLILLIDLLLKISIEENFLERHFKDYGEYRKHTKKLAPFVY